MTLRTKIISERMIIIITKMIGRGEGTEIKYKYLFLNAAELKLLH